MAARKSESKLTAWNVMSKKAKEQLLIQAAQFLADGSESEYLQAKERASMMLGLSSTRLPSNRRIKDMIGQITAAQIGPDEVKRRVREMRQIAAEIMEIIDHCDPFLIGSTLSGKVRSGSDIDLHAYSDDFSEIKDLLGEYGYDAVEEELVQNMKGEFVHLKWTERGYPVEITVYPWCDRDLILYSSVTNKPMKRAPLSQVRKLLNEERAED